MGPVRVLDCIILSLFTISDGTYNFRELDVNNVFVFSARLAKNVYAIG